MFVPQKCKYYFDCPMRVFEKAGVVDLTWRLNYCMNDFKICKRYRDTVNKVSHPDNMLPDGSFIRR